MADSADYFNRLNIPLKNGIDTTAQGSFIIIPSVPKSNVFGSNIVVRYSNYRNINNYYLYESEVCLSLETIIDRRFYCYDLTKFKSLVIALDNFVETF